jgi:Fe-S oxidoreductase
LDLKVWVYTHCHQKALTDDANLSQSLKLIPGIKAEILNSGCCGMAGDFGYKFPEISEIVAHQSLDGFMKIFTKNDILIATGTSCRKQISDIFSSKAIHLPQLFIKALSNKEC